MDINPILVTSTFPTKEEAEKTAKLLVSKKLAVCVNIIGPVISYYEWENKIQNDEEYKLFIKTLESKWPDIKKTIKENHPYTVPEISKLLINDILEEYYSWMKNILA
ncbi:MAG: divalent-cation tolerance protein CutA [Spirochaetia bacterium]|nr:divalent-cation tolerance protein CutA [Spirochaetia bacterium]